MIKVLVVDDSAFMRKVISDLLEKDSRITVVDKAINGEDAIHKVQLHKPDVVTLDVEMPVMNGLEALKVIMEKNPTPVIMVSSTTKQGAETTIRSMEYGAFDFIEKPSGPISLDIHKVQRDLIDKVIHATRVPLKKLHSIRNRQAPSSPISKTTALSSSTMKLSQTNKKLSVDGLVAIGTSTGGPKALQTVLSQLPKDYPHPILIVQHMPKGFTKSFSERLNSVSAITVKEAEDGEIVKRGFAYVAPGGYHLKVRKIGTSLALMLEESELINNHRPSVDALFYSLSQIKKQSVMAVILTGMGSDGKNGLMQLKEHSTTIGIAESNESAIVFGMPRAAIDTKQVDIIANIEEIASVIIRHSH